MTKDQFIQAIKSQTDRAFLLDIVKTALETLPQAYSHNLIYDLYATKVYEGQVYTVTHKETGESFNFAGAGDVHEFFKSLSPKYSKDNLFRIRNKEGRTLYGYTITYIDKTKETIS